VYRAIVGRRIRRVFVDQLSRGDYEAVLANTAPGVEHTFPGEGPLAGTRRSRESLREWFERLFRLFPVLRFEVEEVLVAGWPWRTTVAVRWRDWGHAADGERYANSGCEVFEIRWGRATAIHQYLDTKAIDDSLARMAGAGIGEAAAPPIVGRRPRAETGLASSASPG
jgi:ketosteroid isomerase-like protein